MDRKDLLSQNNEKIKDLDERIEEIFYNAQGGSEDAYEEDYEEEIWRLNCDPNYQASRYESEKRKLLLENRKLIYEIEKEAFDIEFDQMSKSFVSGIVSTDNESRYDLLERELMAKILVRHIVQKDVETPINIGIFGVWGEGKSSFLNLMQKEISALNDANYHHICQTHIIEEIAYFPVH